MQAPVQPNTHSTNHVQIYDKVWSAIFYLNHPTEYDFPLALEHWPDAKYIVYKTVTGKYGENLMGYVQFNRKMMGHELAAIHHRMVWKHQQGSNYSCIRYIKEKYNDKIVRDLVEMGEHWPFRPLPQISEVEAKVPEYSILQK